MNTIHLEKHYHRIEKLLTPLRLKRQTSVSKAPAASAKRIKAVDFCQHSPIPKPVRCISHASQMADRHLYICWTVFRWNSWYRVTIPVASLRLENRFLQDLSVTANFTPVNKQPKRFANTKPLNEDSTMYDMHDFDFELELNNGSLMSDEFEVPEEPESWSIADFDDLLGDDSLTALQ